MFGKTFKLDGIQMLAEELHGRKISRIVKMHAQMDRHVYLQPVYINSLTMQRIKSGQLRFMIGRKSICLILRTALYMTISIAIPAKSKQHGYLLITRELFSDLHLNYTK